MLEIELKRVADATKQRTPFIECTGRALSKLCGDIDLPSRLAAALAKDPERDATETDILVSLDRSLKFAGSGRRVINIALPAAEYLLAPAGKSEKPPKA